MTREDQDDCVSRQAVIETLKESKDVDLGVLPTGNRSYADIWRCVTVAYEKGLEEARKRVECMPSVQPERTCVNCGRTVNNGGWYADGGTRCPIEEHYALPKDGYCHLWEKRNVTDDDYPERREE